MLLTVTANPQLPQAELPFLSKAGKAAQLAGEVTDITFWRDLGFLHTLTFTLKIRIWIHPFMT